MNDYNPFSLAGKTILVTGASSGIGRAAAIECSKAGACVIMTGRNDERLREVHALLASQENQPPFVVADLRQDEDIERLVNGLPQLDGLVNNAGISINLPIAYITREKIQEVLEVNTIAPILLTKQIIRKKKMNKGGSIVFTSSVSGNKTVTVTHEMYSASKAAISGFMRNAALDLSVKGIRCNAVLPGMINTPMVHSGKYPEETLEKDKENYPLQRFGEPEEVAYGIIYLLSDAAAWVTGHSLVIDGGLTLH